MTRSDKILLGVSIVVITLAMFWARSCGINSVIKHTGRDTIITVTKTDTIYQPKVTTITSTRYIPKVVHDTLETFEIRIDPADTAALLADYYATRFYRDSQNLKRGSIIISDSVTRNRITSRRLQTFNTDTIIHETTILHPPKPFQLFFGVNGAGGAYQPLYAGVSLMLKTPKDFCLEAGVYLGTNGKPLYWGGVKVVVRVKRK